MKLRISLDRKVSKLSQEMLKDIVDELYHFHISFPKANQLQVDVVKDFVPSLEEFKRMISSDLGGEGGPCPIFRCKGIRRVK